MGNEDPRPIDLDPRDGERIRRLADREGRAITAELRDAIRSHSGAESRSQAALPPDDPLFTVRPPAGNGTSVSAADIDEILYGGQGY